ncbi:hypothetical protein J6590_105076, partial [Homalodisca vitripennis]
SDRHGVRALTGKRPHLLPVQPLVYLTEGHVASGVSGPVAGLIIINSKTTSQPAKNINFIDSNFSEPLEILQPALTKQGNASFGVTAAPIYRKRAEVYNIVFLTILHSN